MRKKKVVAMLLAGGQGSRLGVLTRDIAKPAVPFGGKYRIIDFPLSNCVNSEIDTVGVLTQYKPLELNAYLGTGQAWDLDRTSGGVYVLPPYVSGKSGKWYSGTANAIYQNMEFVARYDPEYVLILSGDHIYKMDYSKLLKAHIDKKADATIAVLRVPLEEASRFGIMDTDEDNRIVRFEEKPRNPKSDKASMGIYIFTYSVLRDRLAMDAEDASSDNDFGKNIIPSMIRDGLSLYAWDFSDYWKDVGTIESLWEANMDIINEQPKLSLNDKDWRIYSRSPVMPPHHIGGEAQVCNSVVAEGCNIFGTVRRSVIFTGVTIGEGAVVEDSVVMPNSCIEKGARVYKAVMGEDSAVHENAVAGDTPTVEDGEYDTSLTGDITLIAPGAEVPAGVRIPAGMVVDKSEGGVS